MDCVYEVFIPGKEIITYRCNFVYSMKIKNNVFFLMCFLFLNFIALTSSYAKLPIDYDNFTVNGKIVKLPIAELVIDGQYINKSTVGVDPVTINSRTLVPVRALSEKLGYHVTWLEAVQKVTIENANKKIELSIGNVNAKIDNKNVTVTDSVAPIIINNSTYVPIRFVVENMGLSIDYDAKQNKISLNSNGLEELLFDEKTQLSQEKNIVNNSNEDPSVPKDVDRFITPEKPTAPTKPTVPEAPNISDDSNKVDARYEVGLDFSSLNGEVLKVVQNDGELDVNYFYLTEPKRLIIDVKNAKLNAYESGERKLDGKIFLSSTASYDSNSNYTRFSVVLNESVNNSELKIIREKNILRVEKITVIKQGEEFKYEFDRKTGSISVTTSKEETIQNLSSDSNMLEFNIAKDKIKLNTGDLNISNRLVKNMTVSEEGNNYVIKVALGDRVTADINKISATSTIIKLKKQDRQTPRIVLDPGHGGKDAGAINKEFNINEKTLNIQVARRLKQKLVDAGYEVFMTREDDTFVPLNDIASFSNSKDPDIFISMHHNSADSNSSASGIESFYHISSDSKQLAQIIQKHLILSSKAVNRNIKSMPFVVIKKTTSPAILVELGFMSNKAEVQKNMSQEYQELLADAILSGVNEYFGR